MKAFPRLGPCQLLVLLGAGLTASCTTPVLAPSPRRDRSLSLQPAVRQQIELVVDDWSEELTRGRARFRYANLAVGTKSLYLSTEDASQIITKPIERPDQSCRPFLADSSPPDLIEHTASVQNSLSLEPLYGLWFALDKAERLSFATVFSPYDFAPKSIPFAGRMEPKLEASCSQKFEVLSSSWGNKPVYGPIQGIAYDTNGTMYLAIMSKHQIYRVKAGELTPFAGTDKAGDQDGIGSSARFDKPRALATDQAGNVYVLEAQQHRVRKITPAGAVSTLAGSSEPGYRNGKGSQARFRSPFALTVNGAGEVFVSDTGNHRIRKIDPQGEVTTVLGTGEAGFSEGSLQTAKAGSPMGLAFGPSNLLYYVAEGRVLRVLLTN